MKAAIKTFLAASQFAVVGASAVRSKFGNKVLRCYMQHQLPVIPVHPLLDEIEGLACCKTIADLPETVASLSIITPPTITEQLIEPAYQHGIRNLWLQPGAESQLALAKCAEYGLNVIAGGPCILVELGFSE